MTPLHPKALEAAKAKLRETLRRQCAVVSTHGLFEHGVALKVREVLAAGLHVMRYWEGERMVLPKNLPNHLRDELLETSDHLIGFVAEHSITAYLQEAGDGWQSIETAPKDGTKIQVAEIDDAGNILSDTGHWVDDEPTEEWDEVDDDVMVKVYEEPGEGYWSTNHELCMLEEPTHWRPLPTPPGEKGA